ncbi:hypothetical protein ACWFPY_14015 [Nocardia fluminea]
MVCGKCGGSEYIGGHIDPETATRRCDCFGGVIEVDAYAEVIELNSVKSEGVRTQSGPSYSVTVSGDTAAVIGLVNVPGWGI